MGIDATDLFDRYEEDYEDMVGGVPHVEINKMHISQSIEVMGRSRFYMSFLVPFTTKKCFGFKENYNNSKHTLHSLKHVLAC